jgi:hypothetical protein
MNNNYNRMMRELRSLSQRLQQILLTKSAEDRAEAQALVKKIRSLIGRLSAAFSKKQIKQALGALAFLFGMSHAAEAQNFASPLTNPFGLSAVNYIAAPAFVDIDGDGDLDLFVGEAYGGIKYFQNTGTAANPQFASPISNPFGLFSNADNVFLSFGDLDNDGDKDLILGEYYGVIKYFQNTGTATNPQFAAPIVNPFGTSAGYLLAVPTLADIDGDGDLDLLVGDYGYVYLPYYNYPALRFFRNIGTASAPNFQLANGANDPFENISVNDFALPNLVDLDNDGDFDLLYGGYYGSINYHQNTGTAANPNFSSVGQTNPFGLQSGYYVALIASGDLDNDGDIDLLIGEYYGNMKYYRNTTTTIGLDEANTLDFRLYPNPATHLVRVEIGSELLVRAELMDIHGQLLRSIEHPGDGIDISDLPAGVYLVRLTNQSGETGIKRLVKQ